MARSPLESMKTNQSVTGCLGVNNTMSQQEKKRKKDLMWLQAELPETLFARLEMNEALC